MALNGEIVVAFVTPAGVDPGSIQISFDAGCDGTACGGDHVPRPPESTVALAVPLGLSQEEYRSYIPTLAELLEYLGAAIKAGESTAVSVNVGGLDADLRQLLEGGDGQ